ncbi:Lysine--tRNA ligase [Acholeplasma oculi]|uniref:Lysine--tRNA ligase n=1 Tax=Acholeplasma oculi TaxID=35623 RepID=A0A061AEX6_9MOLU|nr:lysine--tRNA ligase [Acholeplasma oculi]CDR30086.1 Lysyl-tRNA synthetase (class II) [Acholeplasma oculi]SKC44909.1 lysyl-tRNA synthetase, class II [Acholeplasma oculi]SUT88338.1 Lysine--tRNA ligase [Acholeplasma oculi]
MFPEDLNEQQKIRLQKALELKEKGIDPFGSRYERSHQSLEIFNLFGDKTHNELESLNQFVSIAGRIVLKRQQGKAGFIQLQDRDGRIQVYIRLDHVGEEQFDLFKHSDLGDIVGIKGVLFRTKTDELTVKADAFIHLTKAITPLPDKFHGLQDKEESRRRRYVDLIVNEDARRVARLRPRIIRAFQHYFDSNDFIEVETPVLHPILGGAAAKPFVTHHNALDMDFYLRIATELPLKRLIVGGLERVYEIGRLFRNEGIDAKHNPEFTTVEAYMAYGDVTDMMDLVEDCLSSVAFEVLGTHDVVFGDVTVHLKNFKRAHMVDLIKEQTGVDFFEPMSLDDAVMLAKKHHVELEKHFTLGHIIEAFFEEFVEKTIIQPTIVFGHPVEISPLAKANPNDPRFTDRFELFIMGSEYANAFTELNDPVDQKSRFLAQLDQKSKGDDEANEMDTDFVEALEYGMPPTGGIGIGIDRIVMLLTNTPNIRDVILFPHARQKTK